MPGVTAEPADGLGPAVANPARVEQRLLELALAADDVDEFARMHATLAFEHGFVVVEPLAERGAVRVEIGSVRLVHHELPGFTALR